MAIIPIMVCAFGTFTKKIIKGIGGLGIERTSADHQNYYIIENDLNTEKSLGELRRLSVTQPPEKNRLLTLMGKTLKENAKKWYMHDPEPVLENDTHKLQWDFDIQTDHLISVRRADLIIINKKRKMKFCKIVDFAVPADHRMKLKECEKRDKYLDLARELKKLRNMKVTIIPIVIGAFVTVTKGLLKGLEDLEVGDWVETIQTTALLKTARILRRVLETRGDLLPLKI